MTIRFSLMGTPLWVEHSSSPLSDFVRTTPMPTFPDRTEVPAAAMLVMRVFGFAFGGIGVAVLCFLWGAPFGEFGSPPLFFRVFGSFIALPFIAFGVAALFGKLMPTNRMRERLKDAQRQAAASAVEPAERSERAVNYQCPNCAAAIGKGADVSPLGDCKCPHCGKWFNIHRQ